MVESKKSFVLYSDLKHMVGKLSDVQAGMLFKHILSYVNDESPVTDDQIVEIAFEPIKQSLKRDLHKWEESRKKRSNAGRIGGLKRAENYKQSKQMPEVVSKPKQAQINQAVNVNVNESVITNYSIHDTHLEDIINKKDTDHAHWLEGLYGMYKLRLGSIGKLLIVFCNHLKATEKIHDNISKFKQHFTNWLQKQEEKKMLNNYKI